jgi:hypothetical protein
MNRRTLLSALGTIGAGGAVVTGTGAFTSVEANRDLTVSVADDANALLALEPVGPNAPYADTGSGQLDIDITGSNDSGIAGGEGVNPNAITVFEDMFEVRNQGTQEVEVSITPLTFIQTGSGQTLLVLLVPATGFPTVTLGVGDAELYSLVVDVYPDAGTGLAVDDTLTIEAEAT